MSQPVVLWFREDLRIADHAALEAAVESGAPVVPVFVLDDEAPGDWRLGGASRWWLHHSLSALGASLEKLGSPLVVRSGRTVDVLASLVRETNAGAVYFHRRYEAVDREIESALHASIGETVEVRRFAGRLLNEPEAVSNAAGDPFRVFTPFWKACLRLPEPHPPRPAPSMLKGPAAPVKGLPLDALDLLPAGPDWSGGLRDAWEPGEKGAHRRLESFVEDAASRYHDRRDIPGDPGTSALSPHLHFGEISPRQVWHAVRVAQQADSSLTRGGDAFLRELGWREFCHHLLFNWPEMPREPFNPKFSSFPWKEDGAGFAAWTRGMTGYPMVDAGMRELWHTGWMHNRVRMLTASFLVKHLLIPWQRGEAWFWDTLVDADLANNACSWQWVAGSGADAAPYFRIFNPVLQGEKFDKRGHYVRRWVPELARLPDKHLHKPFAAPAAVLSQAGVRLGDTYPHPVVEHDFARRRALDAFDRVRNR
ncbi:MAG: deoxyribodipyrimidine photo-lyase [Proteobacteria bacterium]|nr:MAG: deoxyribodipyrimidine photo-lyase [Pseudomonadota bacterium]